MDWLYLFGMFIVWYGSIKQIRLLYKTHSTKSFSFHWLGCLAVSFALRAPRAMTSEYWVWGVSYIVSFILMITLVGLALYYRRENK